MNWYTDWNNGSEFSATSVYGDGLIGCAFGAKIPFVIADGSWLSDGKTLTTGLAGAYLAVELARVSCGMPVAARDSLVLPLAFALILARCGCFFNGCCHGTQTAVAWGIDFGDGVDCHPTQIYEIAFHLCMFGMILAFIRHGLLRDNRLRFYLIAYCAFRFYIEFIRAEPNFWLGLTFYQWAVMWLGIGLVIHWRVDRGNGVERRGKVPPGARPETAGHGAVLPLS